MHTTMNKVHQRGFAILPLLFIIVAVAVAAGIGYAISTQTDLFLSKSENTNIVACTQEAKLCPDGSFVGRTGPNCTFADCPTTNTNVGVNTNTSANTNTTVEPLADWKTYTNTTYGFSFRYPSEFKVAGAQTSQRVNFTNDTMGSISIYVDNKQYSADDLTSGRNEFGDIAQVSVGTKSGYTYSYADAGCGITYYRLPLTGTTLIISFTSCEKNIEPMSKFLESQVLSTFVFTDVTADWKTYTSNTFKFSFKYPTDWKVQNPKSTGDEVAATLFSPQFSAGTTGQIGEVSVIVFKNLSGKTLPEYSKFAFSDVGTIGIDIPQPTTFTVNGYTAQRFDKFTTTSIANIAPRTHIDVKGPDKIVTFILSNTNNHFDAHAVILNEIISTIAFTK